MANALSNSFPCPLLNASTTGKMLNELSNVVLPTLSGVFTNGAKTVRKGDTTGCGDSAVGGSSSVFANGIGVHRKGDGTSGHGSWVANASASGSGNVFAG